MSVGENSMVHCSGKGEAPTSIGNRVVIGVGTNIHGCTLMDDCQVGDCAQVLDKAVVHRHAVIAPGSVVTPGTVVPERELWSGIPARFERQLASSEIRQQANVVAEQTEYASQHATEVAKGWRQLEQEAYELDLKEQRAPHVNLEYTDEEISKFRGEVEGHEAPGSLLDHPLREDSINPDYRTGIYDELNAREMDAYRERERKKVAGEKPAGN